MTTKGIDTFVARPQTRGEPVLGGVNEQPDSVESFLQAVMHTALGVANVVQEWKKAVDPETAVFYQAQAPAEPSTVQHPPVPQTESHEPAAASPSGPSAAGGEPTQSGPALLVLALIGLIALLSFARR